MILIGNVFYNFGKGGDKTMGKITAYKVNNLSKVDLRFYKDGDHFIAPRSVGMLTNGKMKTLQSDLMTELNDLKNRVKALEEIWGRNLLLETDLWFEEIDTYEIGHKKLATFPKNGTEVTLSFLYKTNKEYDRDGLYIYRYNSKTNENQLQITSSPSLYESSDKWSKFNPTFVFDDAGKDFDSLRFFQR